MVVKALYPKQPVKVAVIGFCHFFSRGECAMPLEMHLTRFDVTVAGVALLV